ncbi:MAG: efflux RND transporter permease subunit, partial [Planctomycetota bacterium]
VIEASATRLRPILMTGMSTALGSLPLVLATGAGRESRMTIGVVVFAGVSFATLMTLLVIPACYNLVARWTHSPEQQSQELDRLLHHDEPAKQPAGVREASA